MGGGHPWELTLRQFVVKVRRDYGIEIKPSIFDTILVYNQEGRSYILPPLEWDEVIALPILRGLCSIFQLPPEDFALDPDPDD